MASPYVVAPYTFRSSPTNYYMQPTQPPYIAPDRGMVYLDNYFFVAATLNATAPSDAGGNGPYNYIYNSQYSGDPFTNWDATSYAITQINPDEIQWMEKHHNYLVAFLANSIEFFYDAGNGLGSPLARQPIFSKQLGLMAYGLTNTIAKDKDDMYFIGKNDNNYLDVYVMSKYMIKPVGTHYIREVLNYYNTNTSGSIIGIELLPIDTHTMIVISFTGTNQAIAYFPEEEVWWTVTMTDINNGDQYRSNIVLATQVKPNTQRPYYVTGSGNSSVLKICTADLEDTVSRTASYYTEVIDMDVNYWKHIAKVYSIGDYGQNSLTLWYSNDPTYTNFVQCTTKNPSAEGYQNTIEWSNVTRFRRGSFRIDMTGIGPAHHRAFDIVYNMGTA